MAGYSAPIRDMQYLLHDLLEVSGSDIPGYGELDREFTGAVLQEAARLAEQVLQPLNSMGDEQGCIPEDGEVRTPHGFQEAYDQMRAGGWMGLDMNPEFGGQGLPGLVGIAVGEMFASANMALNMYQGLTHGAASAIHAHGSEQQKATYLPNMIKGRWSGTMNLTEPHCGTDLGLIRTRADPQGSGIYRITGQKIWISAGEHDLTENIIHLVLARIPGGPDGVKGISLFIVPKFLISENGSLGKRNGVSCSGLETKMGIHGNATCFMNYDDAVGYLVGEEHRGMRAMFTMMNEARLGVGLQGYAQGAVAYQSAARFALERQQGRNATGPRSPDTPADPIIVHPDVRRNLMMQKSFIEGARAIVFWGAQMIDRAYRLNDADAEETISLLTPVIKGFLTDRGFETTVLAQQTLGGAGYTREWGLEQFVRDARITMVYEGTNGIQALDLVARKLPRNGGKAFMAFLGMVNSFIDENGCDDGLKEGFLNPLEAASKDLQAAGMYFMTESAKGPDSVLSGAYDFMHLFGHVCLGFMWARMAKASSEALSSGTGDEAFHRAKLATGRFYMARQLPATVLHLARIRSGAASVMELDAADF